MVKKYRGQSYSKLHKTATRTGQLFTDPLFPPTAESVGPTNSEGIVWKRPSEICDNPKLVVDGISTTDLNQGSLGNCWFVAACSCLALDKRLWENVIPDWKTQEWDDEHPELYGGIFHFHFWRLGEWVDVVIDDCLPTRNGYLVFVKSKDSNEFWSALLEKAYAKLAGSYEAMTGGFTGEALVDFTGGVFEAISMRGDGYRGDEVKTIELFEKMMVAHSRGALISCAIAPSHSQAEHKLDCGLVEQHAYAITDVRKVSLSSGLSSLFGRGAGKLMMLRVRNPWGRREWNGPWSDESSEWKQIPAQERDKMNLKVENDGEFWMELHDWIKWFSDLDICRQVNTSLLSLEKTWNEEIFQGEWKGQSAGGSIYNRNTFLNNPQQYVFKVPAAKTEVMLSLTQKDYRSSSTSTSAGVRSAKSAIGASILKVEENRCYRVHVLQKNVASISFTKRRSVFGQFILNAGTYVVVPSTEVPGKEWPFVLRVFSERPHNAKELVNDAPVRGLMDKLCFCFWQEPRALVTVHLEEAHDLKKQDLIGAGADPYCVVKCDKKKEKSPVIRNTLNPTFGTKVNFYISSPTSAEIIVQVWNQNVTVDRFMGQIVVPVPGDGDSRSITEKLMGQGRHSSEPTQGTLSIQVKCSTDLLSS